MNRQKQERQQRAKHNQPRDEYWNKNRRPDSPFKHRYPQ